MKILRRVLGIVVLSCLVVLFFTGKVASAVDSPGRDIVRVLVDLGTFDTMTNMILRADRVSTLKSSPVTLFAVNDRSFQNLPNGRLDELWMDNVDLKSTLDNHIVRKKIEPADLAMNPTLLSENGNILHIHNERDGLYVNDAKVTEVIHASNGNIYIVDKVLFP